MDSQALLGGQDWDTAIFRAFRDAKVFLAWISRVCILEIHFKPEQVGPYAWGPRQASIPLESLADMLAHDGPLGFAAARRSH